MSGPPTKDWVDAVAFLVVEGERYRYGYTSAARPIVDAKVVGVRQNKPEKLVRDQVAVKVTVRLPKAAFEALQPEALIVVSEEMVQKPVVVEAIDPT